MCQLAKSLITLLFKEQRRKSGPSVRWRDGQTLQRTVWMTKVIGSVHLGREMRGRFEMLNITSQGIGEDPSLALWIIHLKSEMLPNLRGEDWIWIMILCMQLRYFPFEYIFQPIISCHPGPRLLASLIWTIAITSQLFFSASTLSPLESLILIQHPEPVAHSIPMPSDSTPQQSPRSLLWIWGLCPDPGVCVSHFILPSPLQLHCNSWSSSNGLLLPQDLHTSSPLCLECLSSISSQIHLSLFFKTYNFRKHLRNRHCFLPSPPHHTLSLNLAKFFYYTKHFIHYFWRLFLTILWGWLWTLNPLAPTFQGLWISVVTPHSKFYTLLSCLFACCLFIASLPIKVFSNATDAFCMHAWMNKWMNMRLFSKFMEMDHNKKNCFLCWIFPGYFLATCWSF